MEVSSNLHETASDRGQLFVAALRVINFAGMWLSAYVSFFFFVCTVSGKKHRKTIGKWWFFMGFYGILWEIPSGND